MPVIDKVAKRVLNWYMGSMMTYGFVRAVTYEHETTQRYYNNKTERSEVKEMLVMDKIWCVMGKTCIAVFAWPGMLVYDLSRLEMCMMRGKNHEEYK